MFDERQERLEQLADRLRYDDWFRKKGFRILRQGIIESKYIVRNSPLSMQSHHYVICQMEGSWIYPFHAVVLEISTTFARFFDAPIRRFFTIVRSFLYYDFVLIVDNIFLSGLSTLFVEFCRIAHVYTVVSNTLVCMSIFISSVHCVTFTIVPGDNDDRTHTALM